MILKDSLHLHIRATKVAGRIQPEQSSYPHIINNFLNRQPLGLYLKELIAIPAQTQPRKWPEQTIFCRWNLSASLLLLWNSLNTQGRPILSRLLWLCPGIYPQLPAD